MNSSENLDFVLEVAWGCGGEDFLMYAVFGWLIENSYYDYPELLAATLS